MSLIPSWLRPGLVAASIVSASAVASHAAAAPAPTPEVAGVQVAPPTSITVSIVNKSRHEVLRDIKAASLVVCRNAYLNGDLGAFAETYAWCPYRTTDAAYDRYVAILKESPTLTQVALAIAPPRP